MQDIGDRRKLRLVGVLDHQRGGSEALLQQRLRVVEQRLEGGAQDGRRRTCRGVTGHGFDVRMGGQRVEAAAEARDDAVVEQRSGRRIRCRRKPVDDVGPGGHQQYPRLGAELPGTQGERADEAGDDLLRPLRRGGSGHEDRVGTAQFPVERDRLRAGGGDVE